MAEKTNSIIFQLGRQIVIGEKSQTELRLGLVQMPVALDESKGGKIFWMCASSSMAIYVIGMTKLEDKGNLVTLQSGSSELFSENDVIMKYKVNQSSINSP